MTLSGNDSQHALQEQRGARQGVWDIQKKGGTVAREGQDGLEACVEADQVVQLFKVRPPLLCVFDALLPEREKGPDVLLCEGRA